MSSLVEIYPDYVYITIPASYICVYNRILAMLADYGEDMLKDCKASCKERNAGAIECYNMFNAAVAAERLGNTKLANTIIIYIKAKLDQIYKGVNNFKSIVYYVDMNGKVKALVSCAQTPKFQISPSDLDEYKESTNNNPPNSGDGSSCNCHLDNQPKHVFLTQAEYDALEVKEKNTLYFIVESHDSSTWHFGDKFPIIFTATEKWTFGNTFPIIL